MRWLILLRAGGNELLRSRLGSKQVHFVSLLEIIFLRARDTSGFLSGNWCFGREEISSTARSTKLFEVRIVLHHESLFLPGDGPAAGGLQEMQHPLPVFGFARVS